MTMEALVFLLVAGAAFGYSGYRFSLLFKMMKQLKGKTPTFGNISERINIVLVFILGQKAVLKDRWIGIAHTGIFWGFLVITLGTLEQFAMTLFNGFSFSFIGETLYNLFITSQDIFTGFVLFGILYAGYRRLVKRPKHLGQSQDANNILMFTGGLMVSIFMMNAFHYLSITDDFREHYIISKHIAALFAGFNFDEATTHTLFLTFKWIHMLLVLGFAAYIPGSKHLHILAAGPNTYLKNLTTEKPMRTINFADETITQYGAGKVSDLSWKDALDLYSCTECGRCEELCPAYNTDKPLSPKNLIINLKKNLYANKDAVLAGNFDAVTHIVDDKNTADVYWACTSCRACEVACPVFIEHTDKIYDVRRNLVQMEGSFPTEVQAVFKNMETNGSPWAFSAGERANWADGLDVPKMAELSSEANAELEVLLWVGCAGSYDDRNKKVLKSFTSLLKKANVKFAILGTEEQCTGDAARRIGNEYLYQTLAQANVDTLNRYAVKRVVTACPHCFNAIKNDYKDLGGSYEVFHHSQFIAKLVSEGRLKPTKGKAVDITFHDSCYLGRWNNVYQQPRDVIAATGANVVEMKMNHEKGMCCGAGGGRMWMEETIGKRVNVVRTEQALETGAKIIASSCPFCMTMLSDGVKTKDVVDQVQVLDIAELMDSSVQS